MYTVITKWMNLLELQELEMNLQGGEVIFINEVACSVKVVNLEVEKLLIEGRATQEAIKGFFFGEKPEQEGLPFKKNGYHPLRRG